MAIPFLPVAQGKGMGLQEKEQTDKILNKLFSKHSHESLNVNKAVRNINLQQEKQQQRNKRDKGSSSKLDPKKKSFKKSPYKGSSNKGSSNKGSSKKGSFKSKSS
ncbi:hypothetical protein SOVF_105610 [Spinacia oleracea]|nr:hypothetical protein SOVF_105610 [Spinacia oleracea]